jgi:hypothetical protein
VLQLIKHYTMKAYGGVDVQIDIFLSSVLAGAEMSATHSGHYTPRGKSRRYPLERRLGGPQSRSEWFGEENIFDPTGTWTPTPQQNLSYSYLFTIRVIQPYRSTFRNLILSLSVWQKFTIDGVT